jgi:hypothetical protein
LLDRRRLFKFSLLASATLAVGGGLVGCSQRSAPPGEPLAAEAREVLRALALGVVGELLPAQAEARHAALNEHLQRVAEAIAQLAPSARGELLQLLQLLGSWPGRRLMAQLSTAWSEAQPQQVHAMLAGWRSSRFSLLQQAYHGLRDLTAAAYFSAPGTWATMGYAGPVPIASAEPR